MQTISYFYVINQIFNVLGNFHHARHNCIISHQSRDIYHINIWFCGPSTIYLDGRPSPSDSKRMRRMAVNLLRPGEAHKLMNMF